MELILNMLDYARLEAGKVVPEAVMTDVTLVAEDVVALLTQLAEQHSVKLRIASEQQLVVMVDRTMLHTILRNLLTNAIKFSPSDSEVLIRVIDSEVQVIDHGAGFGSASSEKGTGLGLDICRRFARLNHAELMIDSEPGKETKVTLHFETKNSKKR